MIDFPAKWQLRALLEAIGRAGMSPDPFRYGRGGSERGRRAPAFHFLHDDYDGAVFFAEYFEVSDPTGYSGVPRGHYHVKMSPGREGPEQRFNQVPWEEVVERFRDWMDYLKREFDARADLTSSVRMPLLPPVSPPGEEQFSPNDIEIIEPVLIEVEAQFIEIVEAEFATSEDLADLRAWAEAEFRSVRAELRRQSKKGFRRTAYGMAANLGVKFGPDIWDRVVPILERVLRAIDELPQLPPGVP